MSAAKECFRQATIFVSVILYMGLSLNQFGLHSLEGDYNSRVAAKNYIDFDNDGYFDLADEGDDGGTPNLSKLLIAVISPAGNGFYKMELEKSLVLATSRLRGESVSNRIFRPPQFI